MCVLPVNIIIKEYTFKKVNKTFTLKTLMTWNRFNDICVVIF